MGDAANQTLRHLLHRASARLPSVHRTHEYRACDVLRGNDADSVLSRGDWAGSDLAGGPRARSRTQPHVLGTRVGLRQHAVPWSVGAARHSLLGLLLTRIQMLWISILNSVGTTALAIGLVCLIGYPVLFTGTMTGLGACLVMGGALYLIWRPHLRETPPLRADVGRFIMVVNIQFCLVVLCPTYTFTFNRFSRIPQTVFALLLPMMKLGAKNIMDLYVRNNEDTKAEFVNFNVEVFHALFVASCLQGSTSFSTTALIIAVDFVVACASIYDVGVILSSIQQRIAEATQALPVLGGPTAGRQTGADTTTASTMHYVGAALFLLQLARAIPRSKRTSKELDIPGVSAAARF